MGGCDESDVSWTLSRPLVSSSPAALAQPQRLPNAECPREQSGRVPSRLPCSLQAGSRLPQQSGFPNQCAFFHPGVFGNCHSLTRSLSHSANTEACSWAAKLQDVEGYLLC